MRPPFLTLLPKVQLSVSARLKLSAVTGRHCLLALVELGCAWANVAKPDGGKQPRVQIFPKWNADGRLSILRTSGPHTDTLS